MEKTIMQEKFTFDEIIEVIKSMLKSDEIQETEVFDTYVPASTVKNYRELDNYPDLMKVTDVKDYLRIGTNAAYELMNHPKCPTLRFGSSLRIRKQSLIQFLEDMECDFAGGV